MGSVINLWFEVKDLLVEVGLSTEIIYIAFILVTAQSCGDTNRLLPWPRHSEATFGVSEENDDHSSGAQRKRTTGLGEVVQLPLSEQRAASARIHGVFDEHFTEDRPIPCFSVGNEP